MTSIFVYGTLMPGQARWPMLAPYTVTEPQPERVPGSLVNTGMGYPGLVDVGSSRWVRGWRVDLAPVSTDRALAALDAIEGTAVGLYRRVQVTAESGIRCWTYEYLHATPDLPDLGGRWPEIIKDW